MNDFDHFSKEWKAKNDKLSIVPVTFADKAEDISLHRQGKLISPIRTPIASLDPHFNFMRGDLVLFTGYPQSGKSEMVRYLAAHYGLSQGCKVAAFTPESQTAVFLHELTVMVSTFTADPDDFINENWTVLEIQEGMPTTDQVMTEIKTLQFQGHGFFIIDPMNWITTNSYTSMIYEALRLTLTEFKQFAKSTGSVVAYIEHPKTPQPNRDGEYPKASVFMVNGGIMHWNKCDGIVIMHRQRQVSEGLAQSTNSDDIDFEVAKRKNQKYLGYPGTVKLKYNYKTFSYEPLPF